MKQKCKFLVKNDQKYISKQFAYKIQYTKKDFENKANRASMFKIFTKHLRYDEDGNLVECEAPNASVLSQMAKKIADTNDDEIIIGKDGEIINKSEIQRQKTQSRLSRKNTERQ